MKHQLRDRVLPLILLLATACHGTPPQPEQAAIDSALYDDLGDHDRPITTNSAQAQRYFDQGLVFCYAFNHDEAIRSFREAARLDPTSAMPWWGIALANGPHINNPTMDVARSRAAWEALDKAHELSGGETTVEKQLIHALSARYAAEPPEDRKRLDESYAREMRALWREHPKDADIGALCAEALMDLHPWDLWTHEGEAKPWTDEIVATIEAVLALAPEHPGANHLYVHAIEASPRPEKALPSADRLRTLVPGAGHLVHMPAHIDLRLGHYAQASEANVRAIAADAKHLRQFPAAGFYRVYMAHNHHFLAFSSMMEGRSEVALRAAREMVAGVPPEFLENSAAIIDGYAPIVLHVLVRFGRWEEVLREPEFPAQLPVANAMRHYARGTALCALGRLDDAEREAAQFAAASAKIDETRTVGNSSAQGVLQVAERMLAGEIAFKRGRVDESLGLLREAVAAEDALVYDEPPDWMMPARHALGATLLQAGKPEDAERAYLEDLHRFPENGWSLVGLARSLEARGATAEAQDVRARFAKAWAGADVELTSSCFCQTGR